MRIVAVGALGGPVADVDDRAARFLLGHDEAGVLATHERAERVDFEKAADVVGQDGFERRGGPGGGAVDESVEAAEVAADAVDYGARGVLVAEIGAEGGGGVTSLGELGDEFLGAVERCVGVNGDGSHGGRARGRWRCRRGWRRR